MKKSIWIFLLAVLLPSAVLGWLALRSAEEQQIIFERRTAELYQKETESVAGTVRESVEAERRVFGETVHRLLANGDAAALARDFSNTLADAWPRKAIGFVLDKDGKLISPTVAGPTRNPEWSRFLRDNSSFLSSSEPALVYWVQNEGQYRGPYLNRDQSGSSKLKSFGNITQIARADELRTPKAQGNAILRRSAGIPVQASEATAKQREELAAGGKGAAGSPLPLPKGEAELPQRPAQLAVAGADKRAKDAGMLTGTIQPAAAAAIREPQEMPPAKEAGVPPAPAVPTPLKPGMVAAPMSAVAYQAIETADAVQTKYTAATEQAQIAPAKAFKTAPQPVAPPQADKPADLAPSSASAGEAMKVADSKDNLQVGRLAEADDRTQLGGRKMLKLDAARSMSDPAAPPPNVPAPSITTYEKQEAPQRMREDSQRQVEVDGNIDQSGKVGMNRQVEPQQMLGAPSNALSTVVPETAEFRALTEQGDEGIVARFVQDKLDLVFWLRPPEAPEMVFGCLVEAANLTELWQGLLERHLAASRSSYDGSNGQPAFVLALLDDKGRPAANSPKGEGARDWKRPFVASEIGEVLPHWEAALYLASPTALADTARGLWRTLAFTIAGAVALIALGGWLVVADARRQLALAQQKTDFVSNVSHELKTPLTSIRMFAELMQDRPLPQEKQGKYLRIITVEAERLTRLINNVLDFAKLGRKQKRFEKRPLDLHGVISRVWESQDLHLREAGFTTQWEAAPGPYPVLGDDDALAQVLVNLLSNAEKYSTERKEVQMHTWMDSGWVNVSVLDRGMGVPNGEERKIFDSFYRAHDSLSSGIQGSGLGLTLAQHVAVEHGGEIKFERRDGGGSRFTLRLPLQEEPPQAPPTTLS